MKKSKKITFSKKRLAYILPILKVISSSDADARDSIIKHMSDDTCDVLSGCVYNAIHHRGVLKRDELYQAFKKNPNDLRYVSNFTKPVHLRKKKLVKFGGSPIGLIVNAVLPIIIEFVAGQIKQKYLEKNKNKK